MRSTGGRRARAPRSGTPTTVGFAALVASLLLSACSGGEARPSASEGSDSAAGADASGESDTSGESADDGIDPEAARLANLLRRLTATWSEDVSYTFTVRARGTFVSRASGQGSFSASKPIQQRSTYRALSADGPVRWDFAVNSWTSSLVASGVEDRPGFRPLDGSVAASIEAVFGPGVEALPFWTTGFSGVADSMTDVDLDPDGTGRKVAFTLPTRAYLSPEDELPAGVESLTAYTLTFAGERVVRIEALRDDSTIDARIDYRPYRKTVLPPISYRGP